ncbi:MAG: tetratricopeptide repeat protein, partial [Candidatus Wallbacteria bacterium]|nr:tetratricopeptide repeat protein [Candidatus Wallbacteria bacterium]
MSKMVCPFLLPTAKSPDQAGCLEERCMLFDRVNRSCGLISMGAPHSGFAFPGFAGMMAGGPPVAPDAGAIEPGLKDVSLLERQEKADLFFIDGERFYFAGDFNHALDEYLKTQAADPEYFKAYLRAGDVYCLQKRFKEAIEQYKKALALHPSLGEVWIKQIWQYRFTYSGSPSQDSMYRRVLDRFRERCQEDRSNSILRFALGMCHLLLPLADGPAKARSAAMREFETAVEIEPLNLWAYWGMKYCHLDMGRDVTEESIGRALEVCRKAIELDPTAAYAFFELGEVHELALHRLGGSRETAVVEYAKALACDPFHLPAHLRLGLLQMSGYQFDTAEEHFRTVIDRDPTQLEAVLAAARLHAAAGRQPAAVQHYDLFLSRWESFRHFPVLQLSTATDLEQLSLADVTCELAEVHRERRDHARARTLFTAALEVHPRHLQAQMRVVELDLALGQGNAAALAEALQKYRDALFTDPNSAMPHFALGYFHALLSRQTLDHREEN